MEAIENIHKALLQLRDSLTHLNSAREQVSQVTAESKEIIDATARLADDVRLLAEKISEETQTVITRFEDRLNESQAGLTGVILLAYVLAIPANEIVIPTIMMLTMLVLGQSDMGAAGVLMEGTEQQTKQILLLGGWNMLTAVCLMVFCLLHHPCSTTIYTIYKETKSAKWTIVATLLPLALGVVMTTLIATVWRMVCS